MAIGLGLASLIGSGISAVSGLFGGSSANKTNLQAVRETNQANKELAQYQADRNLELWNLNNAYNTPEAQMQRYMDAGLNPHLIYGSGSASAGNSPSPAQYHAPTMQPGHVDNTYIPQSAQIFMNGLVQAAQVNKTNAETETIYQNLENLKEDNNLKRLTAIGMQYSNSKTKDEAEFWRSRLEAELANMDSRTILNRSNAERSDSERFTTDALRPLHIELMSNNIQKAFEETELLKFEKSLTPLKRQRLISEIVNLNETYSGKSLENEITRVLINTGVNLRGDALERAVNAIMNSLGEWESAPHWLRVIGTAFSKGIK